MDELFPGAKHITKCCDDADQIPMLQYRRGHAGVAVLWDKTLDHIIHPEADDGNDRIAVIGIGTTNKQYQVVLINSYLPAGSSRTEMDQYRETLDMVFEITQKYATVASIVWLGDLNGSFRREQDYPRDIALRNFCREVGYEPMGDLDVYTYHHNNKVPTSRIGHILKMKMHPVKVVGVHTEQRAAINTSTHDPLIARIHVSVSKSPRSEDIPEGDIKNTPVKVLWDKVDLDMYRDQTSEHLSILLKKVDENTPVEILIARVNKILYDAALCSSTQKSTRRSKGKQRNHVDRRLIPAIASSKTAFWEWKQNDRPMDINAPSHEKMKQEKRHLRQLQRQIAAENRRKKISEIMEASPANQALFHRLVKGQRKSDSQQTMMFGGKQVVGDELRDAWAEYFHKLATPENIPDYSAEHKESVEIRNIIHEEIFQSNATLNWHEMVNVQHIHDIVDSLKNNKAPDMWGISSEHLKYADPVVHDLLTTIVKQIINNQRVPADLKRGVITPVYKGKGDKSMPDAYRRITVTSLIGKVLEKIIVEPTKEILAPKLNKQQRGFCVSSSSVNTALLITEAFAEAADQKMPLYTAFLDASKAFDVVWHQGLLAKIAELGIEGNLWLLYQDLYNDMTSMVKWQGAFSEEFTEQQGVRQGGIPSTELFKSRGDRLLNRLEESQLGFSVGTIDIGVPTCADDMTLLSSSAINLQSMIDIAAMDASLERYQFSKKKRRPSYQEVQAGHTLLLHGVGTWQAHHWKSQQEKLTLD